jgi:nitrile hydratase accessory protein
MPVPTPVSGAFSGAVSGGLSGEWAPPSANGETVFDAPWQGRVFGMAHVLVDAGLFSWDDFRVELIAAIGRSTAAGDPLTASPTAADRYWSHFLEALERVLDRFGLAPAAAVAGRVSDLAKRPSGHDHDHLDHEHLDHGHLHHGHLHHGQEGQDHKRHDHGEHRHAQD